MPIKHSYENIFNSFKFYNCELIHDKEDFNNVYVNADSKLQIIASCGHNYSISYHRFSRKKNNIICSNCNYINLSDKLKLKNTKQKINNHKLESNAINYFKKLVDKDFEIIRTFDGCKADIAIKPTNINENKWVGIQIKSTLNKTNIKDNIGYNFSLCKEYENMITICIAYEDKNIWLFENNDIKHIKSTITIRNNSKYNKFKIINTNLTNILLDKYKILSKFTFEDLDTPLSETVKIEYKYKKLRELHISFINFINNEHEGEVFDFKIGNKKIQEKVATIRNVNRQEYLFNLHKSCGIKNKNGNRSRQNYKIGDCDFYWLHCKDTTIFYVIPENILIEKGYIGSSDGKLKSLHISNTNKKTFWTKEYLFNYDYLDKEKLCKILL